MLLSKCWACGGEPRDGDIGAFRDDISKPWMCTRCIAKLAQSASPSSIKAYHVAGLWLLYKLFVAELNNNPTWVALYASSKPVQNIELLFALANLPIERNGAEREIVYQAEEPDSDGLYLTYVRWVFPGTHTKADTA